MSVEVRVGDCRDVMAGMDAESVDAIVTDPPYELAFMGKAWDGQGVSFDPETWRAAYRVLKPGGHLLAFGGARTFHRLTVAVEDAGFEIRDCLSWLYGSGFPKSHDVAKAIEAHVTLGGSHTVQKRRAAMGENYEPSVTWGKFRDGSERSMDSPRSTPPAFTPQTEEARPWVGWGTALKPAWEPVIVARKPLCGTVAQNVTMYGTGGINVDACRITQGRWPANVALDGCSAEMLGGPSRFFYVAKASRSERNAGLDGMTERQRPGLFDDDGYEWKQEGGHVVAKPSANHHPTVKPVALMRWLVRLVTPPGGLVLDPFAGSGTTGIACVHEGLRFVGIEQDAEYAEIARRRIAHAQGPLLAGIGQKGDGHAAAHGDRTCFGDPARRRRAGAGGGVRGAGDERAAAGDIAGDGHRGQHLPGRGGGGAVAGVGAGERGPGARAVLRGGDEGGRRRRGGEVMAAGKKCPKCGATMVGGKCPKCDRKKK